MSARTAAIANLMVQTVGIPLRRWGYGAVETDRSPFRRSRASGRRVRRRDGRRPRAVRLRSDLDAPGLELADIRHLLLSHIHLDHAGAAGVIVREHPGLTVWVSSVGAPHLI